jgi:hypothetical protein
MRIVLMSAWLLALVAGVAWHYGPGQTYAKLDRVGDCAAAARDAVAGEHYAQAVEHYEAALKQLPPDRKTAQRQLRLEKAKAQMLAKQLPEAHSELQQLVEELLEDQTADAQLLTQARSALAQAQYYLTWLMRLEGLGRDQWEPEIEAARQHYKLLAEKAQAAGDASAANKHQEDLEAAIRLARMDLSELQGLPLPSQ